MPTLNERLGRSSDARLLIVSCDDLGTAHAANVGIYRSLRDGWATTAGLMTPAPWAREAAAQYRGEDIGVHLTLNAEYELFRWGPLTHAPSLLDGDGGFPRTVDDLWDHADVDEVRLECRAQIERAIYWGFDVSHLDSHLGALVLRPEFFDVLLEMAVDFRLPIRLPDESAQNTAGFPFRKLAAEEGVLTPDRVVFLPNATIETVERATQTLAPGVTELVFCPAVDASELRSINPEWPTHVRQLEILEASARVNPLLERAGVETIDYRLLRKAQRRGQ